MKIKKTFINKNIIRIFILNKQYRSLYECLQRSLTIKYSRNRRDNFRASLQGAF